MQWLKFCGIEENVLNTVTKLCSKHFREKDLEKKVKRVYIKPNAVPSFYTRKRKMLKQSENGSLRETNSAKMKCIVIDNVNVNNNISGKSNNE